MIRVLFSAKPEKWEVYRPALSAAFDAAGLKVELATELPPETVDYIVFAPNGPVTDFSVFPKVKAVMSLWAGVETVVDNPTLTQPLTRMVDPALTEGMVEWVAGHVLRHHLGMDAHIVNPGHVWAPQAPPLARDRRVGVLGLGALGRASAQALAGLGFDVAGWSRSAKSVPGIACFDGAEGLEAILDRTEILVLLLPLTPATENLLNASRLARLPQGAVVINPGRGPLIDDAALIAALDAGDLAHATLDVFRTEPLPAEHPFWAHPRVTVTPHIASETRPASASRVIADNIRRAETGQPLLYLVDRQAGY